MAWRAKVLSGGPTSKNLVVEVKGRLVTDEPAFLFKLEDLKIPPTKLRLDSILWMIEEKAGMRLFWTEGEELEAGTDWITPIESRGYFDFEKIQPLQSEKVVKGIGMSPFKMESAVRPNPRGYQFLVVFNFEKQS